MTSYLRKKSSSSLLMIIKSIYLGSQSRNVEDLAKSKHPRSGQNETSHSPLINWEFRQPLGNSDLPWNPEDILVKTGIQRAQKGPEPGCLSTGFQCLVCITELRNHKDFHNLDCQVEGLESPSARYQAFAKKLGRSSWKGLDSGGFLDLGCALRKLLRKEKVGGGSSSLRKFLWSNWWASEWPQLLFPTHCVNRMIHHTASGVHFNR